MAGKKRTTVVGIPSRVTEGNIYNNGIRMVCNYTSFGLNLSLWAPHFGLPIFQHTHCALLPGYSQRDIDVGEMFSQTLVLSWSHPSLSGVLLMCVISTPEKNLKSGWRGKFKNISPTSMPYCGYPGSKAQIACWKIGRPKCGAQRDRFKPYAVPF